MLSTTKTAITAICAGDPTIDRDLVAKALAVLSGEGEVEHEPDRMLTTTEAAKMLGVTTHTVHRYGRRGLVRPMRLGLQAQRVTGYSYLSVRDLIEGRGNPLPASSTTKQGV